MKEYDLFSFGNISLDIIKTPKEEYQMSGGAVLYAVWAAHQLGRKIAVLTKTSNIDKTRLKEFPEGIDIFWIESKCTTSIKNFYTTDSKETRICTNLGAADPYKISDFPEFNAKLIQYSGLLVGEIDLDIIKFLSKKAKLAVDVQGMTRKVFTDNSMEYSDWLEMKEALPYITYFKADAAEAKFITGLETELHEGRVKAGKYFVELGAKEVIISHNQELIAITKDKVISFPFKNKSLIGRTGRGDTSFTTYITERLDKNIEDSLLFATALTSMKMETPGPFKKLRSEVNDYIKENY